MTLCEHGICCRSVSVCLSVTSWHSTKMAKCGIMQTMPCNSPRCQKISAKFQQRHAQRWHQIQVGYVKSCDFLQISCWISETVQDGDIITMKQRVVKFYTISYPLKNNKPPGNGRGQGHTTHFSISTPAFISQKWLKRELPNFVCCIKW